MPASGATPDSIRDRYDLSPPATADLPRITPRPPTGSTPTPERDDRSGGIRPDSPGGLRPAPSPDRPDIALQPLPRQPRVREPLDRDPSRDPSVSSVRQPGVRHVEETGLRSRREFESSYYRHPHPPSYYLGYHDHYRYDHCIRLGFYRGFEFGFSFCHSHYGSLSHIFWYYRSPGRSVVYCPYNAYYTPTSYYLPAYYPSYSTVRYVTEVVDDSELYPVLPSSEPIDPALDASGLADLGWQLFTAGDFAGAGEAFRQSVLADPENAMAKFGFAQALFAVGDYPDAAFLIRRGMELLPDWPALGTDPREHYSESVQHTEQILALRTFLDYVPDDPAGILVLAVQSFFTADRDTARLYFQRLAALDPDDLVAKGFLEHLRGGE